MTESWVASEACTLPTVEQPLRVAEFDALFATHLAGLSWESATRLRMQLVGSAGLVDRVRDLVTRETACCSFFTFGVEAQQSTDGEERVALGVEVPVRRSNVLAALGRRAESALGVAS